MLDDAHMQPVCALLAGDAIRLNGSAKADQSATTLISCGTAEQMSPVKLDEAKTKGGKLQVTEQRIRRTRTKTSLLNSRRVMAQSHARG